LLASIFDAPRAVSKSPDLRYIKQFADGINKTVSSEMISFFGK
jgi:hypothetical protein